MRFLAKNISFTLKGSNKTLLSQLNLSLKGGEILGIIGANGSGKTTLLKILAGLISPTQGEIFYHHKNIKDFSLAERGKIISYMPQKPTIPYGLSVREIIELGRLPHHYPQNVSSERNIITRILAESELLHHSNSLIETLSEGEKARVFLARALAVQAPLLFIDEAGAFLDPSYHLLMMQLLQNEALSWGGAIAIILHDLALASRFCTKLLLLHNGKILAYGAPKDVLTPQLLEQAYGVSVKMEGDIPIIWKRI